MISYNPKDWARFILGFPKSDTFRKLFPWLIAISLYAWLVAYVELHHLKLSQDSTIKNLSVLHSLLGFVISMLLVFRTNTAYDRWWEGRRQWGTLVNNSRNLAIKLASFFPDDASSRKYFAQLIPTFAFELKAYLQAEETAWALDDKPHPEISKFNRMGHVPNQVVLRMATRLQELHRQGHLSAEQMLFINPELTSFLDICGACERIKNT